MPRILLETKIDAPIHRVFDLARSIDLHKISTADSKEKAVAGRKTGLINEHEFVTWSGKHLGIRQRLTSAITYMKGPFFFEDRMLRGPFKKLEHKHFFRESEKDKKTIMKDVFYYKSPFGPLGLIADKLFLKKYLERVLMKRNQIIKSYAENQEKWMEVLNIY